LAAITREIVAARPRTLLETLVVECATALLARFGAIDSLDVRITRPDPPGLEAEAEVVAVTLSR